MNHMTLNSQGQTDYAGDYSNACEHCGRPGYWSDYFEKQLCDRCLDHKVDNLDEYDYTLYLQKNPKR